MSLFTGCVANGALCGPFLISKGFWIDAGRCVLDGDDPDSDEGNLSTFSRDLFTNSESTKPRIVFTKMIFLGMGTIFEKILQEHKCIRVAKKIKFFFSLDNTSS